MRIMWPREPARRVWIVWFVIAHVTAILAIVSAFMTEWGEVVAWTVATLASIAVVWAARRWEAWRRLADLHDLVTGDDPGPANRGDA